MINPNDPSTDQQIHHFKPTDQSIQTHLNRSQPNDPNLAHQSTLIQPPTSKIQNPAPVQWERGCAMRYEREAVWDGWEISKMGEKFRRWSFREERVDGEQRRKRKKRTGKNKRDEREISGEIGGVKYNFFFFFAILWTIQFYV